MALDPLELRIAKIEWRLKALDEYRTTVDKRLGTCETAIDGMAKAEEIAKQVAARMNTTKSLQFSLWQKVGGALFGALVVAESAKGLFT